MGGNGFKFDFPTGRGVLIINMAAPRQITL